MFRKQREQALHYHRRLPPHLWMILTELGIPEALIHARLIGFDGEFITVPIFTKDREVAFFERWELDENDRPVPVEGEHRQPASLYGWPTLSHTPRSIIITEGILESLVLAGEAFNTVSATGDGRSFRKDWAVHFQGIYEVFICFKRGEESRAAARRVLEVLPDALFVELPAEVGETGGVIEFFAHHNRRDFLKFLAEAGTDSSPPPHG